MRRSGRWSPRVVMNSFPFRQTGIVLSFFIETLIDEWSLTRLIERVLSEFKWSCPGLSRSDKDAMRSSFLGGGLRFGCGSCSDEDCHCDDSCALARARGTRPRANAQKPLAVLKLAPGDDDDASQS